MLQHAGVLASLVVVSMMMVCGRLLYVVCFSYVAPRP